MADPSELRRRANEIEAREAEREQKARQRKREKERERRERRERARRAVHGLGRKDLELLAEKPQGNQLPGRLSTNSVELLGEVAAELHPEVVKEAAKQELKRQERRRAEARSDGGHKTSATAAAVADVSILEVLAGLFVLLALLGGNR